MYAPTHSDALSRPTYTGGPVVPMALEAGSGPLSGGSMHVKGRRRGSKVAKGKDSKARRAFVLFAMVISSAVGRR